MRHAVFIEPGRIAWQKMAKPVINDPREAIVRPLVVGRCDLDVAFVRGILPLARGEPIGHEVIGVIVDAGADVSYSLGQKVFVSAQISCGDCRACSAGATGRCHAVPLGASYGMGRPGGYGGALADLIHVPFANTMLAPVPAGEPPVRLIGLADMAGDAWRGIGPHLARFPGARVLIFGGMPPIIGLYAAGLAHSLGAAVVDYVDHDMARIALARSFGASTRPFSTVISHGYEIVFVADPRKATFEAALEAVAPGGCITSAAPILDGVPQFDTVDLYHRGVTWTIGRPDCCAARNELVDAWKKVDFDPGKIPITEVEWDDAPDAWSSNDLYVAAVRRE